jgi:hypothetical protein
LKAQLVEHSLPVMKDPGSNLDADICLFRYWSVIELMSINGRSIYIDCSLMLEPIGQMTKTLNRTMYAEKDHLKNCKTCIVFEIPTVCDAWSIKDKHKSSPITLTNLPFYLPIIFYCCKYVRPPSPLLFDIIYECSLSNNFACYICIIL